MSKLKISEEPLKSSSCINIAMYKNKNMSLNLKNISVKDTNRPTNLKSMKDQVKGNAFERVFCETKSKNIERSDSKLQTHTNSPIPSTSESESQTHLPKSSSWTCTSERQLRSDSSDSSDESSSVSSLTSRESFSLTSSNKSNGKFTLRKSKTEGKLPFKSNLANTKIVLRKPKLNYEPMTNISNFNNDKVLQKKTLSSSNPKNLKVESSQRKAWNERNTTNFYVCKEFYLKVSLKGFKIIYINLIFLALSCSQSCRIILNKIVC